MLETIIAYIQNADPLVVYGSLFLIAFLENVIPPIPGDVPVAFVGYMIYYSGLSFFWAVFWASLGSTAGFMTVYLLSRYLGLKIYARGDSQVSHGMARSMHKFFPPSEMEAVRQKFAAHGYAAVVVNRFLLGSRAVISVVAGLMHLKTPYVLLAAATSATIWNILLLYGGYLLGQNWQSIGKYVALYSIPVSVLFAGFIFYSIRKYLGQRKQRKD
jgi:membrane protein DedA with SNARE-associated domain